MKKKKVNPRRIPIPKAAVDSKAILEEATADDMYRAWLLVGNALIDLAIIPVDELPALSDEVNRFIKDTGDERQKASEMRRAEAMMGIRKPYGVLDPSYIRSEAELKAFKSKVYKLVTFTALCVLYLGLERSGKFDELQMKRIFLNIDLTLAEIDRGYNSYQKLEQALGEALKSAAPEIFKQEE